MADPRKMSGLEFLTALKNGEIPPPAMAQTLGFVPSEMAHGTITFQATPTKAVLNPMGAVHGGWYGALLDTVMGCAVQTTLPPGRIYTTLEYKVNLTRAIPPGILAAAVGTVQHSGRSTAVAQGEIRGVEDGKLYATGSTTCILMDAA
ncbi:MAG: PaaI family thioesterase [Pseudomonadota bacterium]